VMREAYEIKGGSPTDTHISGRCDPDAGEPALALKCTATTLD